MATRDHVVIRSWAERHQAEPATGLGTTSGPSSIDVNDGGAGVRFNFPAAAQFRPIAWDEWFEIFDREQLVFVYEAPLAQGAGTFAGRGDNYYRLMAAAEWNRQGC